MAEILLKASFFATLTLGAVVRNDIPRYDVDGKLLQVSDGSLLQHDEKFYLYGVTYQPCPIADQKYCYEWGKDIKWTLCGWRNMTFSVYSSKDLVSWTLESSNILPQMHTHPKVNSRDTAFFEPSVIYNAKTSTFVMWWILQRNGDYGGQGVAVSKSAIGPFVYASNDLPVRGVPQSADLYLWVDEDTGDAYMKHNMNGHNHSSSGVPYYGPGNLVSRLSGDYTSIAATSAIIEKGVYYEGGGIFKRGEFWYVMFGKGCCFCNKGGSVRVYVSRNPLGNYTFQGEINSLRPNNTYPVPAQQFGVSGIKDLKGNTNYIFIGMRFGSAPDKIKTHDLQYWAPFEFEEAVGASAPRVRPMIWRNNFTIDV